LYTAKLEKYFYDVKKKKISYSVTIPKDVSVYNLGPVNEFPVHGSKMAYGVV
jgi:hypothetical protein